MNDPNEASDAGSEGEIGRFSLGPSDEIQRILISTPARFVGQFERPWIAIQHAWPPFQAGRRDWICHPDSPLGRTALVLAFRTPPTSKAPGVVVPNYEGMGNHVAGLLSVLFGKRFDVHGPLQMSGNYGVPDLTRFTAPIDPTTPWTRGEPRVDHPLPLNLGQISRVEALLVPDNDEARTIFNGAAAFYRRALQAIEDDPEVAYLHLVTAGEILSRTIPFDDERHLDENARDILRVVEALEGGPRMANVLRARIRGIKKRFVDTLVGQIDDAFFDNREAKREFEALSREEFERRVAAAYDLRSQHVHSGFEFGAWIAADGVCAEIQAGKPVLPDKELARIMHKAPRFCGLERIVRYAILGYGREIGVQLTCLDTDVSSD